MGGTLEGLAYDDAVQQEATRGLRELLAERGLDPGLDLPDLQDAIPHKELTAWQIDDMYLDFCSGP